MRTRLLLFFIGISTCSAFGQDLFPSLTRRLAGCEDSTCIPKIERIYHSELKKTPQKKTELQFWSFYLYDSLKIVPQGDSLCQLLLPKANELKTRLASRLYIHNGNALVDSSLFTDAISDYYKGLKLAQRWKDKPTEGQLQRLIGLAYLKLDQHKQAENHLRSSLHIFEALKDDSGIANACISLGNALKEQGKVKESIVYYKRSLVLAEKMDNKRLIAGNYNNLGNAMRRLNRKQEALRYFFQALEMNLATNNKLWISFNYHNIGNTYNDMKQYGKAIPYFKLSNDIKREIGDSLSLVTGYYSLSESYAAIGDYRNAYDFLLRHKKLSDTLDLIGQAQALNELETKYEAEKKEAEIRQLKLAGELEELKSDRLRQRSEKIRNYFILAGIAAFFLLLGVVFLFYTNSVRKRANHQLNEKNNEVEASNSALQDALHELSVKNKEVIDSINYATYIQQATLPNISQHSSDLLRFELFFAPKDIVSGDFYFSYQQHNRSIFGVADCTGHGVPGAMVSLVGMNSLDKVVREEQHDSSAAMVESLNRHVLDSLHRGGDSINDGMDISFCYFDHTTQMLHFTGANHTGLVLRKRSEDVSVEDAKMATADFLLVPLPGARRPIGKSSSQQPFFESNLALRKGDRVVLFSDGYADQTGSASGKKMKRTHMMELLLQSAGMDVAAQIAFMRQSFESWKQHHEQVDDVCLLCVEVLRD